MIKGNNKKLASCTNKGDDEEIEDIKLSWFDLFFNVKGIIFKHDDEWGLSSR